jgi:hypothetical protein
MVANENIWIRKLLFNELEHEPVCLLLYTIFETIIVTDLLRNKLKQYPLNQGSVPESMSHYQ